LSDANWSSALEALQERLEYRFADEGLLLEAITHRSWAHERGEVKQYERLEFLGDAVLGWLIAEALFEDLPDQAEGHLSKLKAQIVSASSLLRYAEGIELGGALRLGVGEERSGGRTKNSLLADAMEAVIGAVYLDGGSGDARKLVRRYLTSTMDARDGLDDPKTLLQERVQGRGWQLPAYRVREDSGPDHAKWFVVECRLENGIAVQGEGRTKKAAQQQAAGFALQELEDSRASR